MHFLDLTPVSPVFHRQLPRTVAGAHGGSVFVHRASPLCSRNPICVVRAAAAKCHNVLLGTRWFFEQRAAAPISTLIQTYSDPGSALERDEV